MPYVNPMEAIAPQHRLRDLDVIHSEPTWSAARFTWDGQPRMGLRWNGSDDGSVGNTPTARGRPTWFVVPEELESALENAIAELRRRSTDAGGTG